MEKDYIVLIAVGILITSVISLVYAGHIVRAVNGVTATTYSINESVSSLINITINNTGIGETANITRIHMNFSSTNCTFNGTNGSSALYTNVTNGTSNYVWMNTTYLINGTGNASFWFYTSCNSPGEYNLSIIMYNGSNVTSTRNINETNITIKINDTTVPNVTVDYPSNMSNYSSSLMYFNLTVVDNYKLAPTGTCWMTLNNGTTNYTMSNYSASVFNYTNTSIEDGSYVAKFYCNDSANASENLNNTGIVTFIVDDTLPVISFSCTPTIINHGGTVTCTCSTSDATSGIATSSYTVNPDTQTFGTRTTTCSATDYAGNSHSQEITYEVISGGGGSTSSGGGGGGYSQTILENYKDFKEVGAVTKTLSKNTRVKIKLNSQDHTVGVKELSADNVKIEVASTIQTATLNLGDEKRFDVTEDGYYDLQVKLNSIESQKASITITSVYEKIPESALTESKEQGELSETAPGTQSSKTWIWLMVIAIVLFLLVVGYIIREKVR